MPLDTTRLDALDDAESRRAIRGDGTSSTFCAEAFLNVLAIQVG